MNISVGDIFRNPIILPIVVLLAVFVAYLLISNAKSVEHRAYLEEEKTVQILEIKPLPFRAHVRAYGYVEPAISLLSKTEVSGKVSFIHPSLKQGESVAAGEVALKIDASDYQASLKSTEADLLSNQESLNQLNEEEKTVVRSLNLAKENLAVGEQEFARIEEVYRRQLVSRSTLDAERQKVISLEQQVEELQGQLNSFSSRKDAVKANIIRAEQQVKTQQSTLGRTEITMPFNARIGEVLVENGEFVNVGAGLFEAIDITGVEIKAQLPPSLMKRLLGHLENVPWKNIQSMQTKQIIEKLALRARVELVGDMDNARWNAQILRFGEAIDPIRRTMSIVVGISNPYDQVIPGHRPPLIKGMYTSVDFWGPEIPALVIPRKAVHEGRVYLLDENNRVVIRPVNVKFFQNELAIIRGGLKYGERVIVSDLYPVIEGVKVKPIDSPELAQWLAVAVKGNYSK